MPELPEVEVVKLFLEEKLNGLTITNLKILTPKSFIGSRSSVIGNKITGFSRNGKQLSIHLSNKLILLVHLKMTGQLIFDDFMLGHPTKFSQYPDKSTRIIITFNNGKKLFFNDQRKFGWIKLLTKDELAEAQSTLGLDIFDPTFTSKYLFLQLQKSRRPVKQVLLDQHYFAGIGNIYANDALFLAKIHPVTISCSIHRSKALTLHRSILSVMRQSINAGGSTAKDNKYLHPDGSKGLNQFHFQVYQRQGQPCLVCDTPIDKVKLGGRGTFFCPQCQYLQTDI